MSDVTFGATFDDGSEPDLHGGAPSARASATRIDVVVDVQATSRHGGIADTAYLRSTLLTRGTHVTTSMMVPVFEENGESRVRVHVPPQWADMDAGGEFTVTVILPAPTAEYGINLVRWTEDYNPQVFDGIDLPTLGGRTAIVWRGTGSGLDAVWQIIPAGQ